MQRLFLIALTRSLAIFISSKPFHPDSSIMPILRSTVTQRISQEEFKSLANHVMNHVFAVRNEFGGFFEEMIYKKELAQRIDGVTLEVPTTLTHGSFSKTYFSDMLVNSSGLFEFKLADALHPRHRGQTLNYLLLHELAHGKVINLRPDSVEHEFVNCPELLSDLKEPNIIANRWNRQVPGADTFRDLIMSLIADWGAGLDTALYEDAITHLLGGELAVVQAVPVIGKYGEVGQQRMRLIAPDVAFKITGLLDRLGDFEGHARKVIQHTTLQAVHWVNITQKTLTFTTLAG